MRKSASPSHSHGEVDAAAEGGGDGARGEVESGEEFGEGGGEGDARPLLRHHDARPDARQVHGALLQLGHGAAQALGAQLHHTCARCGERKT